MKLCVPKETKSVVLLTRQMLELPVSFRQWLERYGHYQ